MNLSLETLIEEAVERVVENIHQTFEIEASGRHIHLSREDLDSLFGKNYELTPAKYLSQPGQFSSKERVTVIGPKASLHQVVILGPVRNNSQVEISATDARTLGVNSPLRLSGDIDGTPGILLMAGSNQVMLKKGLIIAKRHIHVKEEDIDRLKVRDGEIVKVTINSKRPLTFDDVSVRVSPNYETFMHIDIDEANACGYTPGTRGRILKKE